MKRRRRRRTDKGRGQEKRLENNKTMKYVTNVASHGRRTVNTPAVEQQGHRFDSSLLLFPFAFLCIFILN